MLTHTILFVIVNIVDVCFCQVFNVAEGKPAEQAGTYWPAGRAVDGCLLRDDPDNQGCCSASNVTSDQISKNYWKLNLKRQFEVQLVIIYGRTDADFGSQLAGFQLNVIENAGGTEVPVPARNIDKYNYTYTITLLPTKYVTELTIRRNATFLVLCEVRVFAVCDDGVYGVDCTNICGNCLDGKACNKTTGACSRGCQAGFSGDLCKTPCDDGTYGVNCSQICGHCKTSCDTTDGSCPSGCLAGWQGDMCMQACDDGTYGVNCSQVCGHCVDSCNTTDGSCLSGCLAGWQGEMCMQACFDNTYGPKCGMACGNCRDGGQCDHINGTCLMWCEPGWQGDLCDDACPDGLYGQNCTQTCGGCFGTEVCQKTTGRCLSGCAIGWTGHLCSQVQQECASCNNNLGFILGGILAAQSVLVLGIVGYKLFTRHAERKKKENEEKKDNYFTVMSRSNNRSSQAYEVYEGESNYSSITTS